MKLFYSLFFILYLANFLFARPISYSDSWTIMQTNNWEKHRAHLHYSPSVKNSFGVILEDERNTGRNNFGLQWNHLIFRKNTKISQANIYLKNGFGITNKQNTENPFINSMISGDWETRRYFLSYHLGGRYANSFDTRSFHHTGRLGIAPYIKDYGSLHTWLMIQVEHHPENPFGEDPVIATPLLRFFKGDFLAELGYSTNQHFLLNWILRF